MKSKQRCLWVGNDPLYVAYHDQEWGVPEHDDTKLFEMLCLEGMQAGLSWITILKKRDTYRKAFDHFDAKKIVHYTDAKKALLIQDAGIIRNHLKINAIILNAKAFLHLQKIWGSFDKYIWSFVDGRSITHSDRSKAIAISETMSRQLKKDGFRFVGPTICFAFMQAVGMVNDHAAGCFKYKT